MKTRNHQQNLPSLLSFLALLLALLSSAASALPLLRFSEVLPASSPPSHAANPHSIRIDSAGLHLLQSGDAIAIEIASNYVTDFEVLSTRRYVNGDRVIQAQTNLDGQHYSLSLTLGESSLYGYLVAGQQAFQIETHSITMSQQDADAHFAGWIYETNGLHASGVSIQHDYVLPPATDAAGAAGQTPAMVLPLELGNGSSLNAGLTTSAASVGDISNDNFRITQTLSPAPVVVGGTVQATVQLTNTSTQAHTNLGLEIYFFLENSELATAPAFCRQQLSQSLQEVLYCDLGNFAAGETRAFSYSFKTSAVSAPVVYSSLIMGGLRVDDYVYVVQDVRRDSDSDGISDFNESLLNTDPFNAASVDQSETVIDVMAFYTADTAALYPFGVETRINQLVSVANQIYADSGVKIRLRPVYHGQVDYPSSVDMDTTLNDLLNAGHPALSSIGQLRKQYGGDLVMLLRPLGAETSRCGLAPVGGFETGGDFSSSQEASFGYSVIAIDCPDDVVVAHELGHNMGLTHSQREDGMGGTFPFATGYGVDGLFATVMALPAAFNTGNRVARFSNPAQSCVGVPCGIAEGAAAPADAVQTLNLVRHQIASYSAAQTPQLPKFTLGTISGRSTDARIAMAASLNNGLSFVNAVRRNEAVDVFTEVDLDSTHVGIQGSIHVLIRTQSGALFQLDESGRLLRWDGTGAGLKSAVVVGPLKAHQRVAVLQDFRFDAEAVGLELEFFVAYQVNNFEDLIYTATPLRLQIIP